MIGFFQNSMAKHHRLVFGVLLVFIVVSFVFYTGSGSAADLLGMRRSSAVLGVDLNNREETAPYRVSVALSSNGRYTAQDLVQRIFMVKTAEAFQIPEPTQAQLSEYLAEQGFSSEVINSIMRNYDISEDVLRTSIIHSWKIQQFLQTFGGVPAVFEADVELAWKEMRTEWKAEFAELSPIGQTIVVPEPTDEQLAAFYEANKENYRIAELVKLSFAKIIPAADAAAKMPEPTDFELSAFVSEKLGGDAEKAAADLAANRAARVAEWKKSQALDSAAADLSNKLYEKLPTDMLRPGQDEFLPALQKSELGFVDVPAFPRDRIPTDTGVPVEILQGVVSGLNETLWRTDAIPAGDAVYVVVFRGTEPSRIPALSEVKAEVVAAWKLANREESFLALARKKGETLTEAVKAGKSFAEAAKAEGFTVSAPAAFTVQDVPEAFRGVNLVGTLKTLSDGEVSPMIRAGNKVYFAKVVSKNVPAIDKSGEDFGRVWTYFNQQVAWQTFQVQLSESFAKLAATLNLSAPEEE